MNPEYHETREQTVLRLQNMRTAHPNIEMPDPADGTPMRGCAFDRQAWLSDTPDQADTEERV